MASNNETQSDLSLSLINRCSLGQAKEMTPGFVLVLRTFECSVASEPRINGDGPCDLMRKALRISGDALRPSNRIGARINGDGSGKRPTFYAYRVTLHPWLRINGDAEVQRS